MSAVDEKGASKRYPEAKKGQLSDMISLFVFYLNHLENKCCYLPQKPFTQCSTTSNCILFVPHFQPTLALQIQMQVFSCQWSSVELNIEISDMFYDSTVEDNMLR